VGYPLRKISWPLTTFSFRTLIVYVIECSNKALLIVCFLRCHIKRINNEFIHTYLEFTCSSNQTFFINSWNSFIYNCLQYQSNHTYTTYKIKIRKGKYYIYQTCTIVIEHLYNNLSRFIHIQ